MGSVTRCNRIHRFITQFGKDLAAKEVVDPNKTWHITANNLAQGDLENVIMVFTLKCVETGEEIYLNADDIYYEPEMHDADDLTEMLVERLGISEDEALQRLHDADLAHL